MDKSFEIIETQFGNFLINELDLIGGFIKINKYWEHHLYHFYSQIIEKTDKCIDAGANLGFHSIQFGKLSGKVFSFEPQLLVYNQLCANILFNGLDNIIIPYRFALGDEYDKKQMWNIEHEDWVGNGMHNWGGRGIIQNNYGGERAINNEYREEDIVEIRRLDSFNYEFDFMKMDIQGYEYLALKGGESIIDKCKPVILLENPISEDECDKQSKQFLLDKGYELYRYEASNKEDCILIHPESKKYKQALDAIKITNTLYPINKE